MSGAADFSREHSDPLADGLPPLLLDRQRVIHASAFRRLQYKTQVFVAAEDHFRTRLTHTIEVAHLARLIAEACGLRGDLAEVVALAHDLGHPPFGHAGERGLDECMRAAGATLATARTTASTTATESAAPNGAAVGRSTAASGESAGFEHNAHSLRVVELLEHPYPQFRGLNLTRVVRVCLAKHSTGFDHPGAHPLQDGAPPPEEGTAAALADRLAYALHDLQDGLYAGVIDPEGLADLALWRECCVAPREVTSALSVRGDGPGAADCAGIAGVAPAGAGDGHGLRRVLRPTIDRMQRVLLSDLFSTHARRRNSGDERGAAPLAFSPARERDLAALESLLLHQVYRHHRLVRMDAKALRIIREVFQAYVGEPRLMPPRFAARVDEQGAARVACDYIAGMTDRFCLREHAKLFDPQIEA